MTNKREACIYVCVCIYIYTHTKWNIGHIKEGSPAIYNNMEKPTRQSVSDISQAKKDKCHVISLNLGWGGSEKQGRWVVARAGAVREIGKGRKSENFRL